MCGKMPPRWSKWGKMSVGRKPIKTTMGNAKQQVVEFPDGRRTHRIHGLKQLEYFTHHNGRRRRATAEEVDAWKRKFPKE